MATKLQNNRFSAVKYEDFQPKSELKDEPEATLLLVHLPGFLKDHVKITYVHSSRIVRVAGERPLEGNKRSRFSQTYKVPENCKVEEIQGKLLNGILTITMPKQVISRPPQVVPKQEPKPTTTQKISSISDQMTQPKPKIEPKLEKGQEKVGASLSASATSSVQREKQKVIDKTKSPNSQKESPQKVVSTVDHPLKQPDDGQLQLSKTGQTVDHMSEKMENGKRKQPDEGRPWFPKVDDIVERKLEKREEKEKIKEPEIVSEKIEQAKEEETSKKSKELLGAEMAKISEKRKEKKGKWDDEKGEKGKEAMESMKKLAMGVKEDRQALVNMGVAVLVIMTIGAYMSYKIWSSAKAKE